MTIQSTTKRRMRKREHPPGETGLLRGTHSLEALPPLRLFHFFAGLVLILAAVGLWVFPVNGWDQGAQLLKLFLATVSLLGGISLLIPLHRRYPEVQLDPRAERLEVVERSDFGRIARREVFNYSDLSEVDVRDGVFIARDHQGRTVVELPLSYRVDEVDKLRAALGPSFARTA